MTQSTLTKKQTKMFRVDLETEDGPVVYIATVRHDDQCGNGYNTFAITCDTYDQPRANGEPYVTHKNGKRLYMSSCGCNHEAVAAHFPALAPLVKWHLCGTTGPMHYAANTAYFASDKDYRGMAAGEKRQLRNGKTGLPVWERVMRDGNGEIASGGSSSWIDAENPPAEQLTAAWEPVWIVSEGKPRELDNARAAAVWPDATDEDLTAPGLEDRLMARLPALMAEFRAAVELLGFVW